MDLPLPDGMPEELKSMIREVTEVRFTLEVGLLDTAWLSRGLDKLQEEVTEAMSGADPKKVQNLAHMIADLAILKNKLSTAANAALAEKGGGIAL